MKLVKLTANEFLSFYTGILLGDNYEVVTSAVEKLYGYSSTLTPVIYQDNFINFVNHKMPEIYDAMQAIGSFRKEAGKDIMEQINEYVDKFKKEIGSETVDIDVDKLKEYSNSKSQDDLCM